ncbi:MAG: hypothetical protein LBR06_04630 [Bacteroidales bacterium]|jgi:hypothetical protein|nr:hypothetical protein [Bacteroidales bacterium]
MAAIKQNELYSPHYRQHGVNPDWSLRLNVGPEATGEYVFYIKLTFVDGHERECLPVMARITGNR